VTSATFSTTAGRTITPSYGSRTVPGWLSPNRGFSQHSRA
jgi:hypothetical protein